jgi:hypothetical protein
MLSGVEGENAGSKMISVFLVLSYFPCFEKCKLWEN